MSTLRAIITPPSKSHADVIEFVRELLEFCKENPVTSLGFCLCFTDDTSDMIYHHHLSLDPADQDNLEMSALELRNSIIDSIDEWQP